jgi:hypothetical protein
MKVKITEQPTKVTVDEQNNMVIVSSVGVQGPAGEGVPTAGLTDQVLAKASNDDYDTEWVDQTGGGGQVDSVVGGTGIDVDSSDPENPEVSLDSATQSSLSLADSALQNLSGLDTDDLAEGTTNLYDQPPEPGGLGFRDEHLDQWYADINDPTTDPTDLIIIGDSITVYDWVDLFENQIATRYNKRTGNTACPTVGFKHASSTTTFATMRLPNIQGTNTTLGFAGYGVNMTNGQACSGTYNCDGVFVLWKQNTGTLTVKDGGAGGTTVATIDTSEGTGASNITSIDLGTFGSKEIWIGSTGATTLEGIYPTVGNRTSGIRVWRCGHATYTSQSFSSQQTRAYDFIEKIKAFTGREPHVIVATGYNDSETNYESWVTTLLQGVKARTDGSVALWVAWGQGNGLIRSQIARTVSESLDVALIDSGKALGDVSNGANAMNLSPDQAHPNRNGAIAIMLHTLAIMTGDPVGTLATLNNHQFEHRGTLDLDRGSLGRMAVSEFATIPVMVSYKDSADALPELLFASSPLSTIVGVSGPALMFGPGGNDGPDTILHRASSGILSLTGSLNLAEGKRVTVNDIDITPRILTAILANGGAVLTTGEVKRARISVPYSCMIVAWRITSLDDTSGSCVLDIWKNTFANYPATNADSITASAKPTLTTDTKAESTTLTGWTVNLDAGDCLGFEVESATDVMDIKLELFVEPR